MCSLLVTLAIALPTVKEYIMQIITVIFSLQYSIDLRLMLIFQKVSVPKYTITFSLHL